MYDMLALMIVEQTGDYVCAQAVRHNFGTYPGARGSQVAVASGVNCSVVLVWLSEF